MAETVTVTVNNLLDDHTLRDVEVRLDVPQRLVPKLHLAGHVVASMTRYLRLQIGSPAIMEGLSHLALLLLPWLDRRRPSRSSAGFRVGR
jgi:hypothetical protein